MRAIRVLSVMCALAATSLVANAQTFSKVKVHLPYTVELGSKRLAPGDYEIVPTSSEFLFAVYNADHTSFEGLLTSIRTSNSEAPKDTKLVLRDDGQGVYAINQMWIGGDADGYEFLMPKSFPSRKREREIASIDVNAEATR